MGAEAALPPISEEIEIDAPIEQVWRIMTEETPTWLGCLRYRKEIGHTFFMQQDQAKAAVDDVEGATQCEILTLDAPRLFRFSWFVPGFPSTIVSFALEPLQASRTCVAFTHEGWEQFPASTIAAVREALLNGWKSFVLPGLKRNAEQSV
jgi:uncharacterized protein YndB with AHSA1/START domain